MEKSVHKFGGSSLSSAARYQAVANIISSQCQAADVVVVSAAGNTTDTLVKLWQTHMDGDSELVQDIISLVHNHQTQLFSELVAGPLHDAAIKTLDDDINYISEALKAQSLSNAQLLAYGEVWSARLMQQYLNQLEVCAEAIDARKLLFVEAGELAHDINKQACAKLKNDQINIVTGYIASDLNGNDVTLGRNGSDYTATLIARYIDAKYVNIWKDTQGIYSADPKSVEHAIKYTKVCFNQANLMSRMGNQVLHAKTLTPLKDSDIKLVVRSSFDSQAQPTEVVKAGSAKQKRFITALNNYDLIEVSQLHDREIAELSRLTQHAIHHFSQDGKIFILVSSDHGQQVLKHLSSRAHLIESPLNGVAVLCQSGQTEGVLTQTQQQLKAHNINIRFTHSAADHCVVLFDQPVEGELLSDLHRTLIASYQDMAVIVVGTGNVGEEFLTQLNDQIQRLEQYMPVKTVALLKSKQLQQNPKGLNLSSWQSQWHSHGEDYDIESFIAGLSALDYSHKVVIDITASEAFSQYYPAFVEQDCHLISANKYAGTADTPWFDKLNRLLKERRLLWRYNTSVGAGLPINFVLNDLQFSGDKIDKIQGIFSGTLSWLCCHYDGSAPFSELLFQAKEMGYTEPDPREDLSGRDVQRKLLILARELGLTLDLDDIELTPMMPVELLQGDWQSFVDNKDKLDHFMAAQLDKAQTNGKVLRYVAKLDLSEDKRIASVGIEQVEPDAPLATLKAGDNIFVINSRYYQQNDLVIQGPGAGKEVTAAGIHSDLYWLVHSLSS